MTWRQVARPGRGTVCASLPGRGPLPLSGKSLWELHYLLLPMTVETPRTLSEQRVPLGLRFYRVRVHHGEHRMQLVADMTTGAGGWKLLSQTASRKPRLQWKWGVAFKPQSPPQWCTSSSKDRSDLHGGWSTLMIHKLNISSRISYKCIWAWILRMIVNKRKGRSNTKMSVP